MYLSKLRIFGFKSFANKVEVNFPGEGITSVVGPNGCGKSNIIDAIRWVLGEQRVKALRSSKMEDVIFSGTADKPPLNMAEVSLLINNDSGVLPSEYTQIMITRRAFRNGETEYLINNQPCRLKDIHNLFYDTGMGAASYSLIEAKMIDSILSDKAEERRVMFEEASGISKYKQQRKETLRQLERTAQDLARVEDNLKFVQQNVSMFERQAKKAEKWRELKKAYVSLELSYQQDQYLHLLTKFREQEEAGQKGEDRMGALQSQIATQETHLEEGKLLILEEERELNRLNQAVAATNAEVVRLENELDKGRDRILHLTESLQRLGGENEAADMRIGDIGRDKLAAREEAVHAEAQLTELAALAQGHGEERSRLQAGYQERRRRADELAEERLLSLEELSALRNRAGAAETDLQHLQADESELESDVQAASERLDILSGERRGLAEELRDLEALTGDLAGRLGDAASRLGTLAAEGEALRARERESLAEKVALETRQALLQGMQASMEGVDGGVQHLLEKAKDSVQSLLADALSVPPDCVVAVEKCLGRFLQVLLVKQGASGLDLLRELRVAEKGQALLYAARPAGGAFLRARPDLQGAEGFRGWLIDQVQRPAELDSLLELALGHYALVESVEAALALLPKLAGQDFWLVTPAGEMAHASGLILGGAQKGEPTGLLQRKLLLEQIGGRLAETSAQCADLAARIRAVEAERKELEAGLASMGKEQKEAERRWQEQKSKSAYLDTTLAALEKDSVQAGSKLKFVREQLAEVLLRHRTLRQQLDAGDEARKVLENSFHQALEAVHRAEGEKAALEERLRNMDRDRAQGESQVKALKLRQEYLDRSEQEQRELVGKNGRQKEEWTAQVAQIQERQTALGDQIETLHARMGEEEEERDRARGAYDGKAGRLEEIRTQIRNCNDELRSVTQNNHDCALRMEQARSAMGNLRERMFELHEVDLSAVAQEDSAPAFERVEYDAATAADEIAAYKDKLKNLGNINPGALEDYQAEKARLDEVERQFHDLDKARVGLEKAIKKLDKVAREQFLETFAVVQRNFQDVFASLFEGGEAQLALEDGMDPLDARIEINARPTGKKMRGVSLLSGGERALTAISLLFALYLVRPSPYCIMDEVDGPLDDANIGRFVNLLRRFSHQTQFVVVTHNKRTMAASDMLYGVTQEIKGISKLVSVQLDEASRIAA